MSYARLPFLSFFLSVCEERRALEASTNQAGTEMYLQRIPYMYALARAQGPLPFFSSEQVRESPLRRRSTSHGAPPAFLRAFRIPKLPLPSPVAAASGSEISRNVFRMRSSSSYSIGGLLFPLHSTPFFVPSKGRRTQDSYLASHRQRIVKSHILSKLRVVFHAQNAHSGSLFWEEGGPEKERIILKEGPI